MKLSLTLLFALLLAGNASAQDVSEWLGGADGYEQAMRAHDEESTPVAVYFYTDWCGYCTRLNAALADGAVDLQDFVKVRINPEKGQRERALAERYGVMGYPSVHIIPAGSRKSARVRTYGEWNEETSEAFVQACKAAAGL